MECDAAADSQRAQHTPPLLPFDPPTHLPASNSTQQPKHHSASPVVAVRSARLETPGTLTLSHGRICGVWVLGEGRGGWLVASE